MSYQAENIAAIVKLAENNPDIEVLWLYGSRAKGNAEQTSDYDLAVAYNQNASTKQAYYSDELAYQWSQNTLEKISILDINQAPTPLAYAVINDGQVIFCRDPLRLHSEQQRIWSLWEAFCYEHEKNRK